RRLREETVAIVALVVDDVHMELGVEVVDGDRRERLEPRELGDAIATAQLDAEEVQPGAVLGLFAASAGLAGLVVAGVCLRLGAGERAAHQTRAGVQTRAGEGTAPLEERPADRPGRLLGFHR